jgi:hypothetical protein
MIGCPSETWGALIPPQYGLGGAKYGEVRWRRGKEVPTLLQIFQP